MYTKEIPVLNTTIYLYPSSEEISQLEDGIKKLSKNNHDYIITGKKNINNQVQSVPKYVVLSLERLNKLKETNNIDIKNPIVLIDFEDYIKLLE